MRDAVKGLAVVLGIIIGTLLVFYFSKDSKQASEITTAVVYCFIFFTFFQTGFNRPVSKSSVRIRINKHNWVFLIGLSFLGLVRIYEGLTTSANDDLLYGFIKTDYAHGMGFILTGLLTFTSTILIDRKGVKLNVLFSTQLEFTQLKSIVVGNQSIDLLTDSDEYHYKTQKLTEKEIMEINKRIETLTDGRVAQQTI